MLERWSHDAWPEGGRRPIPDSYWVRPGRLLAGQYAGARLPALALRKLRRLLDAGVTSFVDLTEAGEAWLPPYEPLPSVHVVRSNDRATVVFSGPISHSPNCTSLPFVKG